MKLVQCRNAGAVLVEEKPEDRTPRLWLRCVGRNAQTCVVCELPFNVGDHGYVPLEIRTTARMHRACAAQLVLEQLGEEIT